MGESSPHPRRKNGVLPRDTRLHLLLLEFLPWRSILGRCGNDVLEIYMCIIVYIYIHIYIYICYPAPQRSTVLFSVFCWCQRGSICCFFFCKNKVGTLLLSKEMNTYSGQKAQHFLKEAICFELQRALPCLKKTNSFINCNFPCKQSMTSFKKHYPYKI